MSGRERIRAAEERTSRRRGLPITVRQVLLVVSVLGNVLAFPAFWWAQRSGTGFLDIGPVLLFIGAWGMFYAVLFLAALKQMDEKKAGRGILMEWMFAPACFWGLITLLLLT